MKHLGSTTVFLFLGSFFWKVRNTFGLVTKSLFAIKGFFFWPIFRSYSHHFESILNVMKWKLFLHKFFVAKKIKNEKDSHNTTKSNQIKTTWNEWMMRQRNKRKNYLLFSANFLLEHVFFLTITFSNNKFQKKTSTLLFLLFPSPHFFADFINMYKFRNDMIERE